MLSTITNNGRYESFVTHDLFGVVWRKQATADDLRAVLMEQTRFRSDIKDARFCVLTTVHEAAMRRSITDIKDILRETRTITRDWYSAEGLVLNASGLGAAVIRAFTATTMLLNASGTRKVVQNVSEGVSWIAPYVKCKSIEDLRDAELRMLTP